MRVDDEILECVVFLGVKDMHGRYSQRGTGFLFGREVGMDDHEAMYLGTARHVIDMILSVSADALIYIRINRMDGTSEIIPSSASAWHFHSDPNVDLAVAIVAINPDQYDFLMIPEAMIASEDVIAREDIGIGDDVFLVGLFSNHHGSNRNLPILRSGTLSAMPHEPVMVSSPGGIVPMDAYLVEARSIGGLSGSPVFVRTDGMRGNKCSPSLRFWLLGVMRGHWDTQFQLSDAVVPNDILGEAVNMGMSIVIPSSKLIDITDNPQLVEVRSRRAAQITETEEDQPS
jgi:hypothetical protein